MVEIEIGVLQRQCLSRRIPDRGTLEAEIAASDKRRNENQARINRMLSTDKVRDNLANAYPKTDASKHRSKSQDHCFKTLGGPDILPEPVVTHDL